MAEDELNPELSRVLIDEPLLIILPSLAVRIGLNSAVVLQQVQYWISNPKVPGKVIDGKKWVSITQDEWCENFPFWSKNTIRGIVDKLEEDGLLLAGFHSGDPFLRTKFYRISYAALNAVKAKPAERKSKVRRTDYPNFGEWAKAKRSTVQTLEDEIVQTLEDDSGKTTKTETTKTEETEPNGSVPQVASATADIPLPEKPETVPEPKREPAIDTLMESLKPEPESPPVEEESEPLTPGSAPPPSPAPDAAHIEELERVVSEDVKDVLKALHPLSYGAELREYVARRDASLTTLKEDSYKTVTVQAAPPGPRPRDTEPPPHPLGQYVQHDGALTGPFASYSAANTFALSLVPPGTVTQTPPRELVAVAPAKPGRAAKADKPRLEQPPADVKDAIAKLCYGGSEIIGANWARIVKTWNRLEKPDLAKIEKFSRWWKACHWLGKRGDPPKPEQMVSEWDVAQNWDGATVTRTNGYQTATERNDDILKRSLDKMLQAKAAKEAKDGD